MSTGYEKEPIPSTLRWEIWNRDNFRCHYCDTRQFLSVDHKIPESEGGCMDAENLVTACVRCNSQKGAMGYGAFVVWRDIKQTRAHLSSAADVMDCLGKMLRSLDSLGLSEESCTLTPDEPAWKDVVMHLKDLIVAETLRRIFGIPKPPEEGDGVTYRTILKELETRIEAA